MMMEMTDHHSFDTNLRGSLELCRGQFIKAPLQDRWNFIYRPSSTTTIGGYQRHVYLLLLDCNTCEVKGDHVS